jgi:hypothetical protein
MALIFMIYWAWKVGGSAPLPRKWRGSRPPAPPHSAAYAVVHTEPVQYRRIPRLRPPFLHASIGHKWWGGLYAGLWHFRMTTFTDRRMPHGRATSAPVWGPKLEKNDKVRHNIMIQMGSALAVATVFIGSWTPISIIYSRIRRRGGGAYTRDKNTYAGTWAKNGGGSCARGGRNCGILRCWCEH